MPLKPKALDLLNEVLIMFCKNKSNLCKDPLGKEQLKMEMESVRTSKQKENCRFKETNNFPKETCTSPKQ